MNNQPGGKKKTAIENKVIFVNKTFYSIILFKIV